MRPSHLNYFWQFQKETKLARCYFLGLRLQRKRIDDDLQLEHQDVIDHRDDGDDDENERSVSIGNSCRSIAVIDIHI